MKSCKETKRIQDPPIKGQKFIAALSLDGFATKRWRAYSLVFTAAILCYAISYDGDFVFDDSEAVVNNKDVRWTSDFWNFLNNDFWGSPIRSNTSHKSYRPLTVLTFRLNYLIHGLVTRGYHIVNIFLHAAVSALSVQFFTEILKDLQGGKRRSQNVGLLAGLIFAVHPIHTECVANVVGRAELLAALFFLFAFLAYRRQRKEELDGKPESLWRFSPTLLLATLSMLSKEQGITVLGFCAFYELYVLSFPLLTKTLAQMQRDRDDVQNNNAQQFSNFSRLREIEGPILRLLLLGGGTACCVTVRLGVMGFQPPQFSDLDNPASFHSSIFVRLINYNYLYALNAWMLIAPSELCFDYSMGCIPLITTMRDPRVLLVAVFLVVTLSLLLWAIQGYSLNQKVLLTSIVMTVLTFLPASNILFRVGFVLAERVLYLPSLGFCMLLGHMLYQLAETLSKPGCHNIPFSSWITAKRLKIGSLMFLVLWGSKCVRRSSEWRTEAKLFESGAIVCPMNAKVHYNMGKILSDSGLEQDAEQKYRTALRLHPNYDQAMNNLANLLKDKGKFSEAELLLLKAVSIRSDFSAAWMNLGIVQTGLRKYNDAEVAYFMALRHRPFYPDCYFNLGNLYLEQDRLSEAFSAWNNATQQRPSHSKAWINKMIMFDSQDDCETSASIGIEALTHLPGHPGLHFSLGSCLGKLGRLKEAEHHILNAIRTEPDNANYYGNLGVLYHRWNRSSEAEAMYYRALSLDPTLIQVRENLDMLRGDQRS